MAGIADKTIIFRKFDLSWPLLTSIFTWAKKLPKWLRTGSLRAVDRRIARPSSFPNFRVRGGGGLFCPPPPPWRRWLRPPPGRGLNYDAHVNQVCRKRTGLLIGLCHVRHCIPRKVLPTLVSSLVRSLIRYCLSVYGNCTKRNQSRLQRMINFGARVFAGRKKRDHVSDVLKELRWLIATQLHSSIDP